MKLHRTFGRLIPLSCILIFALQTHPGFADRLKVDFPYHCESICHGSDAENGVNSVVCPFSDPLPVGAVLQSALVLRGFARCYPTSYLWAKSPYVSLRLNATALGPEIFADAQASSCYDSWAYQHYGLSSESYPTGLPGYNYGDKNELVTVVRLGCVIWTEAEMYLDYLAPPPIAFELHSLSNDKDRRVLLARGRSETDEDYDYPSKHQRSLAATGPADAAIAIRGKAYDADGAPAQGVVVYFRLNDPPDKAPYAVAKGTAKPKDNADSTAKLTTNPVTTDSTGAFVTTLETSKTYSGENYIVEASRDVRLRDDPAFICSTTNNCWSSATITTWKRMFVEYDEMFRRGAFLVGDAPAGSNSITVADGSQFTGAAAVRLVHAPFRNGMGPVDAAGAVDWRFWGEDVLVTAVAPAPTQTYPDAALLTLSTPLKQSFYRDPSFGSPLYYADGVGVVATGSGYAVQFDGVRELFDSAFVEFRWLDAAHGNVVANVPYWNFPGASSPLLLAKKWMEQCIRTTPDSGGMAPCSPNEWHKYMIGVGDEQWDDNLAVVLEHTYGFVFVRKIERRTSLPKQKDPLGGLSADVVNRESTSHEFAHYFAVNPNPTGGHCQQNMWAKVGKKTPHCPMYAPVSAGDFGDGNPYFHYVVSSSGVVNSEYLQIRKNN